MMSAGKSREIINYCFLSALADDGVIDQHELSYIKSLTLADGVVDEAERRALKRIFALVDETGLPAVARAELHKFRQKYKV